MTDIPTYDPNLGYAAGSKVYYDGVTYEAKWYANAGDIPGRDVDNDWDTAWKALDLVEVPTYNEARSYPRGSKVIYVGILYVAKWYAGAGDIPGRQVTNDWETAWKIPSDDDDDGGDEPEEPEEPTDPILQEPSTVDIVYGETWGNINLTSSFEITCSVSLKELKLVLPEDVVKELNSSWGAIYEFSNLDDMDTFIFKKAPEIDYAVTKFGFNMSLIKGKTFTELRIMETLLNEKQCEVSLKQRSSVPPGHAPQLPPGVVDPFPKRIANKNGDLVDITKWSASNATYKTYKHPTYSGGKYLVGGYFTDWGIYNGFGTSRMPINDINFIQLSFAGIVGPGGPSTWYGNESATKEAKPKLLELGAGKPIGALVILDHWAHYAKKDMNVPEFIKPYGSLAYHVKDYARGLVFGKWPRYPIHNVGGVVLREEDKLNYAYGIQNDLRSYSQALNRNGRQFHIFLSIGGWTLSDPFPHIAANPTYRKNFIDSVCSYLEKNTHINGIDIDWEFVGVDGAKPGAMGPRDSNNYTKLMHELRTALTVLQGVTRVYYHLSAAIGTAPKHVEKIHWKPVSIDGKSYPGMSSILSHIFLMSYDYYGAWAPMVGHQAALYNNGELEGYSGDSCVQYLKNAGVPSRKIVLGVAAYGRIWNNVAPSALNDSGQYTFPNMANGQSAGDVGTTGGVVFWHHLKRTAYDSRGNLKAGYSWVRDEVAKAEFLVYTDPESGVKVVTTTDTPYSVVEKGKYVKEQNLGGIFYWTLDNDNGDILNAMHQGLGSTKVSDSLKPSFRENSLLLYRVKEANHASNVNIKTCYALQKIGTVIGNVFTFGGLGIIQAIESLMLLPNALANYKDVTDFSNNEWEEYVKMIKTVDDYTDLVVGLTVSQARVSAAGAGMTLGYTSADILFSPPMLLGIGLDAAGQDYLMDLILKPDGGDYEGRITRGTIDPWAQMRKDIPAMTYNY